MDATLVRLVFAFVALAGGAGILLYLALWVYSESRRPWLAAALVAVAGALLLLALGLPRAAVVGATLVTAGLAVMLLRGGSLRPGGSHARARDRAAHRRRRDLPRAHRHLECVRRAGRRRRRPAAR